MTNRILLVGLEQTLWAEFMSRCANGEAGWAPEVAPTAETALALLAQSEIAAIVTDVHLSDRCGLELLDEVMKRCPSTLRLVLSHPDDTEGTVRCMGRGHQHLFKPCDATTLLGALAQAMHRTTWLPNPAVRNVVSQLRHVPSPPSLYLELATAISSPHASVETIGEIVERDPAICAKVLQLANSAVFGLQLQIIQPCEAVAFLGFDTTRALVMLAHTFAAFDARRLAGFSIDQLWQHSVGAGRFARQIAVLENSGPETTEQSFSAGLLHDVGKLLLAANLPAKFRQAVALAKAQDHPFWVAETEVLGCSHAELAGYLLGIWGLPSPIVEAVALHHRPECLKTMGFSPLTAVHVANALAHPRPAEPGSNPLPELDTDYLQALGLDDKLEGWQRDCQNSSSLVA